MHITRRSALTLMGSASLAPMLAPKFAPTLAPTLARGSSLPTQAEGEGPPVTGRVLPGLEAVDAAVTATMHAHGVPGASLAIAVGGRLVVARGYGFADVQARIPMRPETRVALASVSKVVTAQTILKLVEQGRLNLDDRAFGWFREMRPPEGLREDPRLNDITIRMCLQHTGGWNRRTSGDPSGWTMRIKRALRLEHPPTPFEMIRYMKGVPLDFNPGSRQVYSNFGFVLLGGVIAQLARQDYPEFAQQFTLHPMGVAGLRLEEAPPAYLPGEAHRYVLPSEHPVPGGNNRMVMAAGGWAGSCVDMVRLLTAIDGSRTGTPWLSPPLMQAMVMPAPTVAPTQAPAPAPADFTAQAAAPSPAHWMGLGWDQVEKFPPESPGGPERYSWAKDGGLAGIQTWVQHLAIGANYALLFNSSPSHEGGEAGAAGERAGTSGERGERNAPGALALIRPKVVEFIRGVREWPAGDLFADFGGDVAR